jgi:hypothetical protein
VHCWTTLPLTEQVQLIGPDCEPVQVVASTLPMVTELLQTTPLFVGAVPPVGDVSGGRGGSAGMPKMHALSARLMRYARAKRMSTICVATVAPNLQSATALGSGCDGSGLIASLFDRIGV